MVKKFVAAFSLGLFLLAVILGLVGYRTNHELEATVTNLFNRQQLLLARQIAHDIRNHFSFLETSLRTLDALRPSGVTGLAGVEDLDRMFRLLAAWNVSALGHAPLDGSGALAVTADGIAHGTELTTVLADSLAWERAQADGDRVYIGPDMVPQDGPFAGRHIMVMAARTGGTPDEPGSGLDFLVVDAMAVARRYAQDVRSGETGYAWIINRDGIFLSHYEDRFLGQSAFSVRGERDPRISYSRINELMAEKLLKGQEGMDWYVSGWHRGVVGEMKKLLAYSPVQYAGREHPERLWSVGLAAPTTEVFGILRPFLVQQWLVTAMSVLLSLAVLAAVIYLSLRWAELLHREVDQKTADLRVERDKVRESMDKLLEAQERLLRSERFAAVGEAASHLAHEIKNPLLLMGGFAAQVRKGLDTGAPQVGKLRDKLQIIEDEAKRLETLLREVSGFTKPCRPNFVAQNINQAVLDTVRLVQSDFSERGIECILELGHNLPAVPFDKNQIQQVLLNLAKNAGEAMPSGGTVFFRSWRQGDTVKVSVQDTGTGMPPEVLERIFSPFFTTKAKGTGLGLAVSFRIMEDHGGDIIATSTPDQGSSFVLTLPLVRSAVSDGSPPASADETSRP